MNKKYIAIILIFNTLSTIVYFLFLRMDQNIFNVQYITPDSITYIESAELLYTDFKLHPTRPLLFALILGIPNLFLSTVTIEHYITFSITLNLISWSASLLILFKSLCLFLKNKLSLYLSLLSGCSLGILAINFQTLTESISILALTTIIYLLLKYKQNKNSKHLIYSLAILNFLSLIKPGFFYLMLFYNLVYLIAIFYSKTAVYKKTSPLYWVSVLIIISQLIGMKQTYGNFTLSYIDKVTWYNYLGAKSEAYKTNTKLTKVYQVSKERMSYLNNLSWSDKSIISKEDFKKQLTNNKESVIQAYLDNIYENTNSKSLGIVRNIYNNQFQSRINALSKVSALQNSMYAILFLLTVLLMLLNYRRQHLIEFIIISIIAYNLLTSGISFWQGDRFTLVIYPAILCFFFYQIKKTSIQKYI